MGALEGSGGDAVRARVSVRVGAVGCGDLYCRIQIVSEAVRRNSVEEGALALWHSGIMAWAAWLPWYAEASSG
jgi:hypothetical protein